jgi:short-subunit dehydrogenase
LILVARSKESLEEISRELATAHGIQAHVIVSDLSQATAPFELAEEVKRRGLHVDYLINNAGFGIYDRFLNTDLSRELEMIQLHVATTTALTKLFAEQMAKCRRRTDHECRLDCGVSAGAMDVRLLCDESLHA